MALNSPLPTFIVLNYQSPSGVHKMTMPTFRVDRNQNPVTFPFGMFLDDDDTSLGSGAGEVGSMIGAFVDVIRPHFGGSTSFTSWEMWQVANPATWLDGTNVNQFPDVIASAGLTGKAGTATVGLTSKGTQTTITYRTAGRGVLRLQLMDSNVFSFERNNVGSTPGINATNAITAYLTGQESIIKGRNGGRITSFMQSSSTLNEKLRRAYGMT